MSLTTVTSKGSTPSLEIVNFTALPFSPRINSTDSLSVKPKTGVSSI